MKPPRVKESAVSLECEVRLYRFASTSSLLIYSLQLYDLKDIVPSGTDIPTTTLVLGLIKQIHVRNAVLAPDGQTVDPHKLLPVARLGGTLYSRLGSFFELERPSWRALKERIDKMMAEAKR